MSVKSRQTIVFATLGLTIVWAWFNIGDEKKINADQYKVATIQPLSADTMDTLSIPPVSLDTLKLMAEDWGPNPFRPVVKQRYRPTAPGYSWELTGIMHNQSEPMAYINRKIVKVGDRVDHAQVVRIDEKSVTIKYKEELIKLTISKG